MLVVLACGYALLLGRLASSRQLAYGLCSVAEDCIKLLDRRGRIIAISETGRELLEATSTSQMPGMDWLSLWETPDARAAFDKALLGKSSSFQGHCHTMTGKPRYWTSAYWPVKKANGTVVAVLCKSRNITDEVELVAELRRKSQIQRDMEDHVDVVFASASPDFEKLNHISSAFERMWELPLSAMAEDSTIWSKRVEPEDLKILRARMREAVESGRPTQAYFRLRFAGQRTKWVRADIYPVVENGSVQRVVSVCVEATEERERLQKLDFLAHYDDLTGQHNRRAMMDLLATLCKGDASFAYLFIDLDRFKAVNDSFGHAIGDVVLQTIARRIRAALPADATVARAGGDEFTVVVPCRSGNQDVAAVCRRLISACRPTIEVDDKRISMTYSIGVALYPQHAKTPESLFTSADIAMYAAKRSGKNTFRVFGDKERTDLYKIHLETEVRNAVRERQFNLHYQPQFCVHTGELVGLEALLRWNHPTRGLIYPDLFIPVLETTGLVIDVGHWIFREALRALGEFSTVGARSIAMSINVSATQLRDSRLVSMLSRAVKKRGIVASQVVVEITESALIDNLEDAQGILEGIRALGIRIAIDDFGTGYSSLSYLTRFSPNIVKLDKSFIDDIAADSLTKTVVEGVIDLAHKLGMSVVAEGVETQEQLDVLRASQCDKVQGYLLGRPGPAPDILERFALDFSQR
ncbi:putative bifunctional diguanylate cyclase/phosphodiesterase [Paraburkholderia bryophila]|nr:GGDEF and EAL domain-containing protein [Paraburkholderia bryophila]